ncbi:MULTISPECIES: hypothetical protein [unclassified Actinomyces]|uniref:hypothetical protein n=1 Tax=unclassified Actinomyces TaxID=2609248 RepID=UPI0020175CD4|nr:MULTISPECIES: hypothetical protein [unclassified Actinomyces]MCL3776552.1 hypothetical protein [Actinomyces sp. AC-20-1]MCL3788838.1 hypothetical protein [Actinomyces sp. 187325]MCL3791056.1 hypothetical protein [Actinomyces sp. 186855]MCL3793418.1 hypothetical protein [Actinomyces sp. 217892]
MTSPSQHYPSPPPLPSIRFTSEKTVRDLGSHPELVRVGWGTYMTRPDDLPFWRAQQQVTLARCAAALHQVPSARALTHEAAAAVLGLSTIRREPDIRLAVTSIRRRARLPMPRVRVGERPCRLVVIHRSLVMPDDDEITTVNGMYVTTPLRTALDCAFDLPVRESLPIIDSALRMVCRPDRWTREATTSTPIGDAVALLRDGVERQGPRRGACRARTALSLTDPLAESPGESVIRWGAAAAGLPAAVCQRRVEVDGYEYFLDLGFDRLRTGWEFDGLDKMQEADDVRQEKSRELRLARAGWRVHRFGWEEVRDPERMVGRMQEIMPLAVVSRRKRTEHHDLWV